MTAKNLKDKNKTGISKKVNLFRAFVVLISFLFIIFVALQNFPKMVSADINHKISYQGKLTDDNYRPVADGSYNIIFVLWDASSGGSCVWTARGTCGTPTARSVSVTNGIFSILLGDTGDNSLASVNFNQQLWLALTVGTDSEMTPRREIGAVAAAFNSDMLDNLETSNSGGTTAFVPVTNSNGNLVLTGDPTGTGVNQGVVYINPASASADESILGVAVGGSSKLLVDAEGDVGMAGQLAINGASIDDNRMINISVTNNSADVYGLYGTFSSNLSYNQYGVYNLMSASGSSPMTGVYNSFTVSAQDAYPRGIDNTFINNTTDYYYATGVRNQIPTFASNNSGVGFYGLYNYAGSAISANWFWLRGVQNWITTSGLGATTTGLYNYLVNNNTGTIYGAYNSLQSNATGAVSLFGSFNTYTISASDTAYGNYTGISGSSTGGTIYGDYINLNDTDVTSWSFYTPSTGNAGTVGVNDAFFGDDLFVGASISDIGDLTMGGDDLYIFGDVGVGGTLFVEGNILPADSDDTYNLGSDTRRFANLYLGPSSIYMGGSGDQVTMSFNTTSDLLTFQNSVDSTTGFQFLDANGGIPIINADTINEFLGIGEASPDHKLDVEGNIGLSANSYVNWGDTDGETGYGFKDNSGSLEFKDSGGAWTDFSTLIGGSYWQLSTNVLNPTTATYDLAIGGIDTSAPFFFDESAEELILTNTTAGDSFRVNDVASDTTPFIINTTGSVGIGTASPGAKVDVVSDIDVDANTYGLRVDHLSTNGATQGLYNYGAYIRSTNDTWNNEHIIGVYTETDKVRYGSNGGGKSIGVWSHVKFSDTYSAVSNLYDARALMTDITIDTTDDNDSITNAVGLYISRPTVASGNTITNLYGILIANQDVGSTLNYAIYSIGGKNYLGGSTGIGTTAPDRALEVNNVSGNNLRLTYNDSNGGATNYADFLMSSSGDLTISPSGNGLYFQNDVDATAGIQFLDADGGTPIINIDTTNEFVGIGNTTPGALLDLGLAGSKLGTLRLEGSTSGYVQIQPATAAGSWTFTLPADDGNSSQVLVTDGSGVTSWGTVSGVGSKTTRIFPEYPGAIITPDGASNTGYMTSDVELHGNYKYNYYQWESSEATLQDYDIYVKWQVPDDFTGFQTGTNDALLIDMATEAANSTDNKIDVRIYEDGSATPASSDSGNYSSVAGDWHTDQEGNAIIYFDDSDSILSGLSAGDVLVIHIKMFSLKNSDNKYARIGAITLNWKNS